MSAAPKTISPKQVLQRLDDGSWILQVRGAIVRTAFQPILRFANGKLVAAAHEALMRPEFGGASIPAMRFLQSLTQDDRNEIEMNLRHLHVRNAAALPSENRTLFINFDPSVAKVPALMEADIDDLGRELRQIGMSPRNVVCEITEQAASARHHLKDFTWQLRARGYLIAVDDFGAAASDMARVEAVTPDIVKIDRGLVMRLMDTPEGYEELKRLLKQFRSNRIQTILEGLEKLWHIEMAEAAGADLVQGYALGRPEIATDDRRTARASR